MIIFNHIYEQQMFVWLFKKYESRNKMFFAERCEEKIRLTLKKQI